MEGSGVDLGRRLLLNHSDLCLTVAWPGFLWHQPVAVPSCPRTLYHAVPTPFTRMPQRQYCQRRQWGIWLSNLFRFFWSWFLDILWVHVLQDSMELFLPCLWALLYWYLLFMASLIANHGGKYTFRQYPRLSGPLSSNESQVPVNSPLGTSVPSRSPCDPDTLPSSPFPAPACPSVQNVCLPRSWNPTHYNECSPLRMLVWSGNKQ